MSKNQKTLESFMSKTKVTTSNRIKQQNIIQIDKLQGGDNNKKLKDYQKKYKNYKATLPQDNGNDPIIEVDKEAAQKWYYAVTKEFREYQFQMVETSLFNNTMVCLPTGLGKTFIAANVIFNYYLWFPTGKIFFLAPTRPLVTQQLQCIRNFEGIDENDIVELTGMISQKKREQLYEKKKIFFMTPQSLQNDLKEGRYQGQNVSLIVFDEAHHGTGKYSYTVIIEHLEKQGYGYRILALSATPGNEKDQVKEVIQNMKVARLEVKDEDDPEVKPYIHEKEIDILVIQANFALTSILEALHKVILLPYQWLCKSNIVPPRIKKIVKGPGQINRGIFYEIFKHFQANIDEFSIKYGPHTMSIANQKMKVLSQLTHGKKTLNEQSITCFQKWLVNFQDLSKDKIRNTYKNDIQRTSEFKELLEQSLQQEQDGNSVHPKSIKMQQILSEFFSDGDNIQNKSKVMIFTQNRNNVQEIKKFIEQNCSPELDIKPQVFIGQASSVGGDQGMNQKKQQEIIQKFKDNQYNVLIATCIGEEGLDIGEVDLIICYDSGFSPIRMIQRIGRTGRKREGRVKILLMHGKEQRTYEASKKNSQKLKKFLKQCCEYQKKKQKAKNITKVMNPNYELGYYSFNPRMIPEDITPQLFFLKNSDDLKVASAFSLSTTNNLQSIQSLPDSNKEKKSDNKFSSNHTINIIETDSNTNQRSANDVQEIQQLYDDYQEHKSNVYKSMNVSEDELEQEEEEMEIPSQKQVFKKKNKVSQNVNESSLQEQIEELQEQYSQNNNKNNNQEYEEEFKEEEDIYYQLQQEDQENQININNKLNQQQQQQQQQQQKLQEEDEDSYKEEMDSLQSILDTLDNKKEGKKNDQDIVQQVDDYQQEFQINQQQQKQQSRLPSILEINSQQSVQNRNHIQKKFSLLEQSPDIFQILQDHEQEQDIEVKLQQQKQQSETKLISGQKQQKQQQNNNDIKEDDDTIKQQLQLIDSDSDDEDLVDIEALLNAPEILKSSVKQPYNQSDDSADSIDFSQFDKQYEKHFQSNGQNNQFMQESSVNISNSVNQQQQNTINQKEQKTLPKDFSGINSYLFNKNNSDSSNNIFNQSNQSLNQSQNQNLQQQNPQNIQKQQQQSQQNPQQVQQRKFYQITSRSNPSKLPSQSNQNNLRVNNFSLNFNSNQQQKSNSHNNSSNFGQNVNSNKSNIQIQNQNPNPDKKFNSFSISSTFQNKQTIQQQNSYKQNNINNGIKNNFNNFNLQQNNENLNNGNILNQNVNSNINQDKEKQQQQNNNNQDQELLDMINQMEGDDSDNDSEPDIDSILNNHDKNNNFVKLQEPPKRQFRKM